MTFGTRLACFVHYQLGRSHIAALLAYIAGSAAYIAWTRHTAKGTRNA